MSKRVKMLTSKWHQNEKFCTNHFRSLKCMNFGLSRKISLVMIHEQWKGGGGVGCILDYMGPHGFLTGPKWHMHN